MLSQYRCRMLPIRPTATPCFRPTKQFSHRFARHAPQSSGRQRTNSQGRCEERGTQLHGGKEGRQGVAAAAVTTAPPRSRAQRTTHIYADVCRVWLHMHDVRDLLLHVTTGADTDALLAVGRLQKECACHFIHACTLTCNMHAMVLPPAGTGYQQRTTHAATQAT